MPRFFSQIKKFFKRDNEYQLANALLADSLRLGTELFKLRCHHDAQEKRILGRLNKIAVKLTSANSKSAEIYAQLSNRLQMQLAQLKTQQATTFLLWDTNEQLNTLINLKFWIVLRQPVLIADLLKEHKTLLSRLWHCKNNIDNSDCLNMLSEEIKSSMEHIRKEGTEVDTRYRNVLLLQYRQLSSKERSSFSERELAQLDTLIGMLKRNQQEVKRLEANLLGADTDTAFFFSRWKQIEERKTQLIEEAIAFQKTITKISSAGSS